MLPNPAEPNEDVDVGLLGCKGCIVPIPMLIVLEAGVGCRAEKDDIFVPPFTVLVVGFIVDMLIPIPCPLLIAPIDPKPCPFDPIVGLGVLHSNFGASVFLICVCTGGLVVAAEAVCPPHPQSPRPSPPPPVSGFFPRTNFSNSSSPFGLCARAPGKPPKERKSVPFPLMAPEELKSSLSFWVCSCSILCDCALIADMKA